MTRPAVFGAVALISAASVAYEVLLVRMFALEQFHHVAYMAISVAMLGFGVSGTVLALIGPSPREPIERRFRRLAVAAACATLAAPLGVRSIPLDLTQLLWDQREWLRLGTSYILIATPFFFSGAAILSAITLGTERPGWVYGASFLGAAIGALAALGALHLTTPAEAVLWSSTIAASGAVVAALGSRAIGTASLVLVATVAVASSISPRPRVNQFKALPQAEAYPGAVRVAERPSPLGWVTAVRAEAFRYAPGLSLAYQGDFPAQIGLFVDGEIAGAVTQWQSAAEREMLRWLPTALPFVLEPRKALILGAGSGGDVELALVHGTDSIVAVELNRELVDLARSLQPLDHPFSDRRVRVVLGDARSYVARTEERFDLVSLGPSGGLTTAAAGVHSLNEDFLHTVDAYVDYLKSLRPGGVLAITRWLRIPPRDNVRVTLTAAEALRRLGIADLGRSLIVARSWGTGTVLVKPDGFTPDEVERIADFAASRQLDLDWYPGVDTSALEPIHQLGTPALTQAAAAAVHSRQAARAFAARYPFRVEPVGDSRPYPHQFLTLRALWSLLQRERGSWLPFAEWGLVALVATLFQSVLIAGAGTLLPVALSRRRGPYSVARPATVAAYFGLIGLAYLAAEVALIQQLQLLLGHPLYAVSLVFSALLIFSGLGSALSDRLRVDRGAVPGAMLSLLLGLYSLLLIPLVHAVQPAPLLVRVGAGFALLAPAGLAMGMPFPLGLRRLVPNGQLAWAWAVNGFASVVGAALAALVALEAGSPTLLVMSAAAYALAAFFYTLGKHEA